MALARGAAAIGVIVAIVTSTGCREVAHSDAVDASVDAATNPSSDCPMSEPTSNIACTGTPNCEYGSECCAGHCYASRTCTCSHGAFVCGDTDACLGVAGLCGGNNFGGPASCSSDAECAAYCFDAGCCEQESGRCKPCSASPDDAGPNDRGDAD